MGRRSQKLNDNEAHNRAVKDAREEEMTLLGVQRMASYVLVHAFNHAQKEVRRDPYSLGPEQRFLMDQPVEDGGWEHDSSVRTWCIALDIDYIAFRDRVSDLLDALATKVILDPERHALPTAQNDDEPDDDDADFSAIVMELFVDLPVHTRPSRDVTRASRPRPLDLPQFDFESLAA